VSASLLAGASGVVAASVAAAGEGCCCSDEEVVSLTVGSVATGATSLAGDAAAASL